MSLTLLRTRVRRSAAVGLSATMAATGLVASMPAADAASGVIDYTCTAEGFNDPFPLPVVLDTNAPARMTVGQTAQVTMTASAVLPGNVAQNATSTWAATQFDGSWTATATFGAAPVSHPEIIGRTQLGDQTERMAVPFSSSSTQTTYTAPATPGNVQIVASDLGVALEFYDSSDGPAVSLTCAPKSKAATSIDTIAVVAASTTTLTLDKPTSAFGQDVLAVAKVTTSAGGPDGDVAFSVDGVATTARVDKDGVASLVLPDAGAGAHSVTATFVPRDATSYDGSTSAPTTWTVTKARTKARVPVTGKTTKTVTRVGVRAKGAYATVPTGKVRVKVKRIGKRAKWTRVRTLDDGAARVGFGKLRKGRYQVVVVYRGDANHTDKKKTKRFRVTRG